MRVFMKVEMPPAASNRLAREGNLAQRILEIVDELQPEEAYFLDSGGKRAAYLFLEIEDSSEIPRIAEPWFLTFEASVEVHPVMGRADFEKASAALERAAKKYAA